jgi:hypothetical protein
MTDSPTTNSATANEQARGKRMVRGMTNQQAMAIRRTTNGVTEKERATVNKMVHGTAMYHGTAIRQNAVQVIGRRTIISATVNEQARSNNRVNGPSMQNAMIVLRQTANETIGRLAMNSVAMNALVTSNTTSSKRVQRTAMPNEIVRQTAARAICSLTANDATVRERTRKAASNLTRNGAPVNHLMKDRRGSRRQKMVNRARPSRARRQTTWARRINVTMDHCPTMAAATAMRSSAYWSK